MRQDSRRAFDHHLARVMGVSPTSAMEEGALLGVGLGARGLRAHPFGAEPRLASAAAAEHQPGGPRCAAIARAGGS